MPTKPLRLPAAGTSPNEGEARVKAYIHGGAGNPSNRAETGSGAGRISGEMIFPVRRKVYFWEK